MNIYAVSYSLIIDDGPHREDKVIIIMAHDEADCLEYAQEQSSGVDLEFIGCEIKSIFSIKEGADVGLLWKN